MSARARGTHGAHGTRAGSPGRGAGGRQPLLCSQMSAPIPGTPDGTPDPEPIPVDRARPLAVALTAIVFAATTLGPVYFVRFHFAGGFPGSWEDDRFVVASFGALYLAALGFLPLAVRRLLANWYQWLPLAGLALLAPLSALWSEVPALTARRGLLFCGTTLIGLVLGGVLERRELLYALALSLGGCSAASAALAVLAPSWGTQAADGVWAGLYFNRNSLAPVAALAVLSCALVALEALPAVVRVVAAGAALVGLLTLVMSGGLSAAAALVLAALGGGLSALAARARRQGRATRGLGLGIGALAVVLVVGGFLARSTLLGVFHKSPTLENRTPLWSFTLDQIATRPWSGFGFYTHWVAPLTHYATFQALRWEVPTAHNGLLETALGLGVGGALLLLLTLIVAFRLTLRTALAPEPDPVARLPLMLLLFAVVMNLTESFVLPNQILWVLVPTVTVICLEHPDTTTAGVQDGSGQG